MNELVERELALWRALRESVAEHPELGVTAIGPKPETLLDDIRVTIEGQRFIVLLGKVPDEE